MTAWSQCALQRQGRTPVSYSAAIALALENLGNALVNGPDAVQLVVALQAPWNASYPHGSRSWAQLSRLPSTVISDQSSLGNCILASVYADCLCDAKKSLNAFTCQVQQDNVSALLDQIVQKQLR